MIYYEQDKNRIKKYKVIIDEYKLERLKLEIIDRCSLITAEKEQTFNPEITKFRFTERRDVTSEMVVQDDVDYAYHPILYDITYREYMYPNLALYIEGILNYNPTYLHKVLAKENLNEETMYKARVKSLLRSFNKSVSDDCKKAYLEKLKKVLDNESLNEGQVPEMAYYEKVMELIRLDQMDSIYLQEIERVLSFLELDKNLLSKKISKEGTNNN